MRKSKPLQIGEQIRIVSVPGAGDPGYFMLRETRTFYRKLVARGRPVRIQSIDEYGNRWFTCRFRRPDGTWEWHYAGVFPDDTNWVRVRRRTR